MTTDQEILCLKCSRTAMLDRVKGKKSALDVHRLCWQCARAFYEGPTVKLVGAVLRGVIL